jgi:prepilin-type N-terminal cleavage/methylation domain-containing protein
MHLEEAVQDGRRRRGEGAARAIRIGRAGLRGAGGFTMLELMLVVSVLAIAFVALSRSLVGSMAMSGVNRESALATDGVRQMIEVLQGVEEFDQVWRLYNADPGDDPGPGPAPGNAFDVPGLRAVAGDADGRVGEIVFPDADTGAGLGLFEDLDLPDLGRPRDLDADGDVDGVDCSATYRLLPVLVRLRWQGPNGERTAEVSTILADR